MNPAGPSASSAHCGAWHRFEPDRPRRAAPGLRVCGGCRDRTVRALAAMPRLHAALGTVLAPARTSSGEIRSSKGDAAPWPISPAAAEARDAIASGLRADARWVRRARGLDGPVSDHPAAVGAWLLPHADYMLNDADAASVAEKYATLRGQALALIDPQPRSMFPLPDARCPEPGPCGMCGGVLWATVTRDRPLTVDCAACGAAYGAAQLLRLGHRITTLAGRGVV